MRFRTAIIAVLTLGLSSIGAIAADDVGAISNGIGEKNVAVAQDPTTSNVLVVWDSDAGGIQATRVSPGGVVLDTAGIAVSPVGASTFPAVTWDGTEFLVVWQAAVGGCGSDIRGARVSSAG